jgi:hypothetical protein
MMMMMHESDMKLGLSVLSRDSLTNGFTNKQIEGS